MAQFILRGKTFDLDRNDIESAVRGRSPERIQKYAVSIGGKEWPIKQVVRLATSLQSAEFTAHDAFRVLQKIGYEIVVHD